MQPITKKILCVMLLPVLLLAGIACTGNRGGAGESSGTGNADGSYPYGDDLPKDLNFGKTEIRFITTPNAINSIDVGEEDNQSDTVNAAIWRRNREIEERLNVLITDRKINYTQLSAQVGDSVMSQGDDYEVALICGSIHIAFAPNGWVIDMSRVNHLDFSKEYWGTRLIDAISYNGKKYYATGDLTPFYIADLFVMYVNETVWVDNISPKESKSVFQIVNDGEWTFEKMKSLIANGHKDLDGNGYMDNNDRYGLLCQIGGPVDAFMLSQGIKYSKKTEEGIEITLGTTKYIDIYEKLYDLFYATEGVKSLRPEESDDILGRKLFADDQGLFYVDRVVATGLDVFRNMKSTYNIVPLPKYSEKQKNYITSHYNGAQMVGILSTVPTGRYDAVGATLELMSSVSHETVYPQYYEVALKRKYIQGDESAEMLDLIRKNITNDFLYIWGNAVNNITGLTWISLQAKEASISSRLSANMESYNQALATLTEKLDALK